MQGGSMWCSKPSWCSRRALLGRRAVHSRATQPLVAVGGCGPVVFGPFARRSEPSGRTGAGKRGGKTKRRAYRRRANECECHEGRIIGCIRYLLPLCQSMLSVETREKSKKRESKDDDLLRKPRLCEAQVGLAQTHRGETNTHKGGSLPAAFPPHCRSWASSALISNKNERLA